MSDDSLGSEYMIPSPPARRGKGIVGKLYKTIKSSYCPYTSSVPIPSNLTPRCEGIFKAARDVCRRWRESDKFEDDVEYPVYSDEELSTFVVYVHEWGVRVKTENWMWLFSYAGNPITFVHRRRRKRS